MHNHAVSSDSVLVYYFCYILMRTFLDLIFNNEKMIVISLIILFISLLFLIFVSFVKRDYIVSLKSYKLFQERLDNLFLTQKNLYPFMFILVLFSFVTFFLLLLLSLYFSLELYFDKMFDSGLSFVLFFIGTRRSLLITIPILCGSFVLALTLWNSILFQELNKQIYWINTVLLALFLSAVVVFSIEFFPHAWAQGGDNLSSVDLSTQYKMVKSSDITDQQFVNLCKSNPNIFLHNASTKESCVCSTEFTVFDNLAETFAPKEDRDFFKRRGVDSARNGFNEKSEHVVLVKSSMELKLKCLFLQRK